MLIKMVSEIGLWTQSDLSKPKISALLQRDIVKKKCAMPVSVFEDRRGLGRCRLFIRTERCG